MKQLYCYPGISHQALNKLQHDDSEAYHSRHSTCIILTCDHLDFVWPAAQVVWERKTTTLSQSQSMSSISSFSREINEIKTIAKRLSLMEASAPNRNLSSNESWKFPAEAVVVSFFGVVLAQRFVQFMAKIPYTFIMV